MFQEFIVCTLFYVLAVAFCYSGRSTTAAPIVDAAQPVNYFPEGEEETETTEVIQYPAAVPAFTVDEYLDDKAPVMATADELMSLTIRQLKKLASGNVTGYSNLTKRVLAHRLAGLVAMPCTD